MPRLTRYLTAAPRRSTLGGPVVSLYLDGLSTGSRVFARYDTPDCDGEIKIYTDESLDRGGYVDAAILSETPPTGAPKPKAEVVEEEVVVTTTRKTIVLRLTEEEAATVYTLLYNGVGGTPGEGHPRGALDRVRGALTSAGVSEDGEIVLRPSVGTGVQIEKRTTPELRF